MMKWQQYLNALQLAMMMALALAACGGGGGGGGDNGVVMVIKQPDISPTPARLLFTTKPKSCAPDHGRSLY